MRFLVSLENKLVTQKNLSDVMLVNKTFKLDVINSPSLIRICGCMFQFAKMMRKWGK